MVKQNPAATSSGDGRFARTTGGEVTRAPLPMPGRKSLNESRNIKQLGAGTRAAVFASSPGLPTIKTGQHGAMSMWLVTEGLPEQAEPTERRRRAWHK